MYTQTRALELVSKIYDATLQPALWPAVLLDVSDWLHAESCHFFLMNGQNGTLTLCHAVRTDPLLLKEYDAHYASVNPWVRPAMTSPAGTVVTDQAFLPGRELRHTEFFNDWLRRRDVGHGLFAIAVREDDWLGALSAYRSDRKGTFDVSEIRACELITPHLRRAMQLTKRLVAAEALADGATGVLNNLSQAILLLDHRARVTFRSSAAEKMLQHSTELAINKEGRLCARSASVDHELSRILSATIARHDPFAVAGIVAVPRRAPFGPLVLLVAPIRVGSALFPALSPSAIVFLADPSEGSHPPIKILAQIYGLTKKEIAVALQLLSGEGLPSIADTLGLSVNTVRTHVKRAFSKTGTRSQSQLVSLLLKLPDLRR